MLTIVLTISFAYGFSTSIIITASQVISDIDKNSNTTDDSDHKENTKTTLSDSESSVLLVLGDSIGAGIGDEMGEGIGEKFAQLVMKKNNQNIDVINLAVPGSKTYDLSELINENDIQDSVQDADIIFISIGGNDLKKILNEESLSLLIDFEELIGEYTQQINRIYQSINELNSKAQVVVIGLYNPYGEDIGMQKIKLLLKWNYETQDITATFPNFIYIPTYDLYQYHLDSYLTFDKFHPNTKGYQVIAERIHDIIFGLE
jgi:lysophospholipase L1-like esterase